MWYIIGFLVVAVIAALAAMVRVVVVEEATAVAFKFMGRFSYFAMEFTDRHFDAGKIVVGDGASGCGHCWGILRIGGWIFYLRPFVSPAKYSDTNNPDMFGEGIYVRLHDITPEPDTAAAETAEPESVPLNVKFVARMQIVNPYLWLFRTPRDVNNQVVKRLDAALRSWVRSGDQRHAQVARGDGTALWNDLTALGCIPVFDKIEQDWGLRILENSIIVEDVGYEPGYQQSLQAASKAKLEANASVEETAGRVFLAVATELGMSADELRAKLKAEPKFKKTLEYKKALDFAKDMVKRDRAGASGDLRDIRVGSSDGTAFGKGTLAEIIGGVAAAFAVKDAGGGKQANRGKGAGGKKPSEMTDEESEQAYQEWRKGRK